MFSYPILSASTRPHEARSGNAPLIHHELVAGAS